MSTAVIDTYIQRHEGFLETMLHQTIIPAPKIRSAIHYALFPGGKRIRPVLIYLAGQLLNVHLDVCDVLAASIELTHCYSLIHDDLPAMDNDDLRRGKPSCHKAFDEATAILAGDGMQALAIELLLRDLASKLKAEQILAIAKTLTEASGVSGMVSGQSLDLSELASATISQDQLSEIHRLKTGKLLSACCTMVLATQDPLDPQTDKALRTYAEGIGLAFQMQDDYLDHYAPASLLGKSRSSDVANAKTTFASLFSKEQLGQEVRHQYARAIEALTPFGDKAGDLIVLTQQLEGRSVFAKG